MAEGLARAMAPPGVEVFSAGSEPTSVRDEAVSVMAARGIDISGHTSKHFDAIPLDRIDTIVTLCAEERCPVVNAEAERLHWPLPDPAGPVGPPRMQAFRSVAGMIAERLETLFADRRGGVRPR